MNRASTTPWFAFGFMALAVAACSTPPGVDGGSDVPTALETGSDGGAETAVDAATDAPRGDTSDAGATLSLRGYVASSVSGPLAGAEVADELHPEVAPVLTDADGMFTLRGVPSGTRLLFRVSAAGHIGLLAPIAGFTGVSEMSVGMVGLFTRDGLDAELASSVLTTTAGTGLVLFGVSTPAMTTAFGTTIALSPPSGRVLHANSMVDPPAFDPTLGASTADGNGLIFDVAPGEVQITATSLARRSCAAVATGWEGTSPGSVRVPIRADYVTHVGFNCAPTPGRRFVYGRLGEYQAGVPAAQWLPVSGAEVCLHHDPATPCSTSVGGGLYAIDAPESAEIALAFRATGRDSILVPLRPAIGETVRNTGLPVAGYAGTMATAFATTQGTDSGSVEFFASAGATATLTPATPSGAHYLTTGAVADPALTATSTQGWGYFFGATPGEAVFTLTHPTQACSVAGDQSWPSTMTGSIRLPVAAGFTTFVTLRCM